jgi:hypothetical protein
MNRKLLSTLLTIVLMLNVASILLVTNVFSADADELNVVDPISSTNNFTFYTSATSIGDTFYANVTVVNAVNMTGWQLNVSFNPSHLQLIDITVPADHVLSGLGTFLPTAKTIDNTDGWVLWAAAVLSGDFDGSGTVAQLEFQIAAEPAPFTFLHSQIHLVLSGEAAFFCKLEPSISFTTTDADYYFIYAPPTTTPYISVEPSYTELGGGAPIVGTVNAEFSVDININNLASGWRMIAIQFKVTNYNTTVLNVTGWTEGPFMASFAPPATSPATWFAAHDDGTELVFGIFINNHTAMTTYPSGSGTLVTIDFEAIYEEEFPWFEDSPIDVEPLFGNWAIDPDFRYIDFDPAMNGTARVLGYILGRNIDVFTQWPFPYGGQGINKTSDMFWPQKTVCLTAYVTYNLDPVQHKLVAFEVRGPFGQVYIFSAFTNTSGYAEVCFQLPWPCIDPETEIFGIWEVVATVDIGCEVVEDWLWFKVWWRVEITEVIPKESEYMKTETACFDIYFKTYAEQPFWTLITMVVLDDLNVPIGTASMWVYVGGEHEWCTFLYYNITLCAYLPKHAFVGTGTVKVNALSDWPSNGGHPYCPEATATFRILRMP